MPDGDRVGSAHVDIHVNAGPGEAELAAFKAKVDRDFAELDRKKAEASLQLKSTEFDAKINKAKQELDNLEHRKARTSVELDKAKFDAEIAEAKAEIKALGREKATVSIDSKQLRDANRQTRLLAKGHALEERAALQAAKAERAISAERQKTTTDTIKNRSEIAKLSETYEKLRGKQIALEKSSRRVFSSGSIAKAEAEARKLERVGSEAEYVKHKIEKLGGSVAHLDPQLGRNTSMLDRWLSRLGDTSIRIGPITTSIKGLGTGLALLGPLVFELGGGLVSLVGTIGEGLAGAATVGAGALAGLVTSAAGVGFVIGPMVGEFKEVTKATQALSKAELKYGKGSSQVKTAQEQLNHELRGVSPIAREGIEAYSGLKEQWKGLTKAARPAVFTAFGESLKTVQALLPGFASESVKTTQVAGKAWGSWMKSLRSSEAKKLLGSIMSDFRASIPGLSSGLGSLVAMLGRLSAAGAHFLPGLSNGFAEWANNLEQAVGGGQKLQSNVGSLVNQMQDFGHLTQHTGSLLVHIFDASATSGDGLVKSLDKVIQRWDKWTQSASGKSGLNEFFGDSQTATEDFMSSLSHMTKLLFEFSRATAPVANGLLKVVTFIGDLVSAADGLVGVKEIFQGVGLVLAGLFVASKVLTYADAIKTVATRLGGYVGISTAAAAAEAEVAVSAGAAATALEAEALAATQADVALGAGAASATRAALGLEGTAGSAGLLSAALAPEVLIPAGLIAAFGILVASNLDTTSGFEDLESASRRAGKAMQDSLGSSASTVDRYVAAQHKNSAVTNEVTAARRRLVKLQNEDAPLKKITHAVEALNAAEQQQAHQAHETGVINRKQIDAQHQVLKGATARVKAAKEAIKLIHDEERFKNKFEGGMQPSVKAGYQKQLTQAERTLAAAKREVAQAQRQETTAAVPYERSLKGLKPISEAAERGLRKLVDTIGSGATKKIGSFVDPKDVAKVTDLGNKLTRLGRGGQVKNIAVKSQGADQTIAKLQRLQKQTNRVEGSRASIKIGANDTQAQSKLKHLAALSQKVSGARQTIHILANADSAEQAIQRLQQHLHKVAAQKYQATMSAVDKTQPGWQAAYHHLRETASKKYEARITAIDDASSKAKSAESAAKGAGRQKPKINITASNAQALGAISAVQSSLSTLRDKTVNVNVVTHKSGGFSGGPAGMYYSTFATGGINDREIQRANEKAIRQQSGPSRKIMRPTMLVGEQSPSHPEYVIATNPAFKSSNERYLEDAAGEFGKEVVPAYAGGGKKGKGKSGGKKGGASGGGSGPGPHPPKGMHKAHWYLHHETFAPASEHQVNVKEGQIEELEHEYAAEEKREQYQIDHNPNAVWNTGWFKQKLEAERQLNRDINQTLIPRAEGAAEQALKSANRTLSGEASAKNVRKAHDASAAADKAYSSAHKGKHETDAEYRKRKAGLKAEKTKKGEAYDKIKKERENAKTIHREAQEKLDELHHKVREGKIADSEAGQEIAEVEGKNGEQEEYLIEESEEYKRAKADLVDAGLRGDVAGEEAARKRMVQIDEREYNEAKGTPSPEDDISIGERLKQDREETTTNGSKGTLGEQTASYNEAREQLYQQFASNIFGQLTPTAAPGVMPIGASGGAPSYAPGGMTAMGMATPSLQGGASTSGADRGTVKVVNNFAAPPPDPHTWTRQQEFELGALA